MTEMIERVARAMMKVTAKRPGDGTIELPVLSMDPDFDDLPENSTEGTVDDEVTKEAVMRLARAAIEAMRDLPEEPGPRYTAGDYSRRTQEAMIDDALGLPRFP
jgi:hypothetical protein